MKFEYPSSIREEELKNRVADDFFGKYDCAEIIKNIDFAVKARKSGEYLLWAEAKAAPSDILAMLAQLVLTIGKARTFNEKLPPKFLGCFDCEKIAFIPYADIQDIFHQNDFNWKIAPSNRESKEFKLVYEQVDKIINSGKPHSAYCFHFGKDENSLKLFILKNFIPGAGDISKIRIDKNNFISIYGKWLETVKPTIQFGDWAKAKKAGIIDGDFYLADLLSADNKTLKEKLFVLLKSDHYEMSRYKNEFGLLTSSSVDFADNQKAHNAFWAIYERPPKESYWDYIIDRRDLLVPQDIRERKGSFYTPRIWVELSQKYLADVFGKDWQDEYYVWDCAAGTGNLLAGLANKYNIWASTLDKADADVMHERIKNGANLLEGNVFQFDFLNDSFDKLPEGLRKIINDEKKRKKLIVYINPPYAEAMNKRESTKGKIDVNKTKVYAKNLEKLGKAGREIFIQFLTRIYTEIPGCKIGEFSTQKALIAPNFKDFRMFFLAKLKKCFIVPADTFDNVKGQFPIGFKVWDTEGGKHFKNTSVNVYDATGIYIGKKTYQDGLDCKYINDWLKKYIDKNKIGEIGAMCCVGNDFQHNNYVNINFKSQLKGVGNAKGIAKFAITQNNLIVSSIYYVVRHIIPATWLNDRDQFLYPNDSWEKDREFQNNCLAYTLFSNNISSKHGTNHWIPFIEWDVGARAKFDSNFMTDFIEGKVDFTVADSQDIFWHCGSRGEEDGGGNAGFKPTRITPIKFSKIAKKVFSAGLKLWQYYHAQPNSSANASLYDIREHFQGRGEKGKMNAKSDDEKYSELIGELRAELKALAAQIEPKVYEHGFLRE